MKNHGEGEGGLSSREVTYEKYSGVHPSEKLAPHNGELHADPSSRSRRILVSRLAEHLPGRDRVTPVKDPLVQGCRDSTVQQ